jgi:hypothetical protein
MKYIGNYNQWINPEWIAAVEKTEGKKSPTNWKSCQDDIFIKNMINANYDINNVLWYTYTCDNLNFNINPPWCDINNKIYWWIIKQNPGQCMPVHVDPSGRNNKIKRFWVALQNYEIGHIFLYKNKIISDYVVGDVYEFDDYLAEHGSTNIGFNPRISLQIIEFL